MKLKVINPDPVTAIIKQLKAYPFEVEAGNMSFFRGMKQLHMAKDDLHTISFNLRQTISTCQNHIAVLEARHAMKQGREI